MAQPTSSRAPSRSSTPSQASLSTSYPGSSQTSSLRRRLSIAPLTKNNNNSTVRTASSGRVTRSAAKFGYAKTARKVGEGLGVKDVVTLNKGREKDKFDRQGGNEVGDELCRLENTFDGDGDLHDLGKAAPHDSNSHAQKQEFENALPWGTSSSTQTKHTAHGYKPSSSTGSQQPPHKPLSILKISSSTTSTIGTLLSTSHTPTIIPLPICTSPPASDSIAETTASTSDLLSGLSTSTTHPILLAQSKSKSNGPPHAPVSINIETLPSTLNKSAEAYILTVSLPDSSRITTSIISYLTIHPIPPHWFAPVPQKLSRKRKYPQPPSSSSISSPPLSLYPIPRLLTTLYQLNTLTKTDISVLRKATSTFYDLLMQRYGIETAGGASEWGFCCVGPKTARGGLGGGVNVEIVVRREGEDWLKEDAGEEEGQKKRRRKD